MLRSLATLGALLIPSALHAAQEMASAEQLLNDLGCGACHEGISVESDIREKAPDLSLAGIRLSPDYMLGFLQYPVKIRQYLGLSRMPDFGLDEREALALTLYLQEQVPEGVDRPVYPLQEAFVAARSANPDITARMGAAIFSALNCLACHKLSSAVERELKTAPDLSIEGARVTRGWLAAFLRNPTPVRPLGALPGTGSRHPDFMLSASEADSLTEYLLQQQGDLAALAPAVETAELLAFSVQKAEALLRDKLPCLGCHRLGDDGGRIGPDLASIRQRLKASFVYQMIRDPQSVTGETVMPKIPMPDATLELLVNYLMHQDVPRDGSSYPSLIDNPPFALEELDRGPTLYRKHCAACHGVNGEGDGYNARFLPADPTKHADSSHMATRPNDTLFDGIFAGGLVLNKSPRMPPWGFTLEREDIRHLVAHLRRLCRCEPPAWSRR